ncbi:MAG: hypothetical protein PHC28_16355 [Flavobacterium sp.]|uniref:hypothetical protein n=1 Tax=Flavobacterium sp. TaxID=239 RepID=UPI002610299E|nr:hypothetical protein [Flavobacterium sp.]MDD5152026.1 hypothetical protein [Flavobacterium sp.]
MCGEEMVDLRKDSDKYAITSVIFWVIFIIMSQIFVLGFVLPAMISADSWYIVGSGIIVGLLDLWLMLKFVFKL